MRVPQTTLSRTMMTVTECNMIRGKTSYEFLVSRGGGTSIKFDLTAVLYNISILTSLFRWRTNTVFQTVAPKQPTLAVEDRTPMLPPVIGGSGASSSSSTAIVRVETPTQAQSGQMTHALAYLYQSIGFNQEVCFDDINDIHWSALERLKSVGAIDIRIDEILRSMVSVVKAGVNFAPLYGLKDHMLAFRFVEDRSALKSSKVYHMVRLHEEGWRPGQVENDFRPGRPQLYNQNLKAPCSYFRALRECAMIFQKGALVIKHRQKDGYYQVLLKVGADKLQATLLAIENLDAGAIKQAIIDAGGDAEDEEPEEPDQLCPGSPGSNRLALLGGDLPALPPAVQPVAIPWRDSDFRRCRVLLGRTDIKVYFDNMSTGVRRGWADCKTHRCGCIRVIKDLDRNRFAVAMALWHRYGFNKTAMTRVEHLAFWPAVSDIEANLPNAQFIEF